MADHATPVYGQASGNDYAEHEKTYRLFLGLAKYGTIISVIVLSLMALTLV